MLASLEECCDLAARAGVTLLLEPINRYEIDDLVTLDQAAAVIKKLGRPKVKTLADTFHMNIEEVNLTTSLRHHAVVLGHVHLVDSNREVPGHGHVNMRAILQTLRDIGLKGYISFEALALPDPQQAASDGIRTVRAILASLGARS